MQKIGGSMKTWLKENDVEIYSTHNNGISVAAERSIKTLKNKIFKYMTSTLKNLDVDKLEGTFYEKQLQKTNETEFRAKKVTKKKSWYIICCVEMIL